MLSQAVHIGQARIQYPQLNRNLNQLNQLNFTTKSLKNAGIL